MAEILWLIPKKIQISLLVLITPFNYWVWLTIGLLLLLGSIVAGLLDGETSLFSTFSLVLGVAWSRQPQKQSSRLYLTAWALPGHILAQFYLASLLGQLSNQSSASFKSFSDLLSSSFILGCPRKMEELFVDTLTNNDLKNNTDSLNSTSHNYLSWLNEDEYEYKLSQVLEGKNKSLALIVMSGETSKKKNFGPNVYCLKNSAYRFPIALAMRPGFPFTSQTNNYIYTIIESGLSIYWIKHLHRKEFKNISVFTLKLEQFAPALLLLPFGAIISVITYALEVAIHSWKMKKVKL